MIITKWQEVSSRTYTSVRLGGELATWQDFNISCYCPARCRNSPEKAPEVVYRKPTGAAKVIPRIQDVLAMGQLVAGAPPAALCGSIFIPGYIPLFQTQTEHAELITTATLRLPKTFCWQQGRCGLPGGGELYSDLIYTLFLGTLTSQALFGSQIHTRKTMFLHRFHCHMKKKKPTPFFLQFKVDFCLSTSTVQAATYQAVKLFKKRLKAQKHLVLHSFNLLKFNVIKNQVSTAANLTGILQRERNKFPALKAHSLRNKRVKRKQAA